jgi:hypothetical protein
MKKSKEIDIDDAVNSIYRTALNLKDAYDILHSAEFEHQHEVRRRMIKYVLKDEVEHLHDIALDLSEFSGRQHESYPAYKFFLNFSDNSK